MATLTVELTDQQAAALRNKLATKGLTIEDWIAQMAAHEAPIHKPQYTLEELLAQCDTDSPLSAEDRAWLDAPAVGREAL
jgi:hypothetical protein